MPVDKKTLMEEVKKMRLRLFTIANAFAGDETGWVAVSLHGACNEILRAWKTFDPEGFEQTQKEAYKKHTEQADALLSPYLKKE